MKRLLLLMLFGLPLAACTTAGNRPADFDALAEYDAVMIEPVTVVFDENWEPKTPNSRLPLSERELDNVRRKLAAIFDERFRSQLEAASVRIADRPGDGVLLIKPELRDVWLYAPAPESVFGSIYIRRVGSMQLHAEFVDAETNERLLILQDDKQGRDYGYMHAASSTQNRFLLQQMFDEWALVIAEDLLGPRYANH
jgi:hypothetical protein